MWDFSRTIFASYINHTLYLPLITVKGNQANIKDYMQNNSSPEQDNFQQRPTDISTKKWSTGKTRIIIYYYHNSSKHYHHHYQTLHIYYNMVWWWIFYFLFFSCFLSTTRRCTSPRMFLLLHFKSSFFMNFFLWKLFFPLVLLFFRV